MALLRLGTKLIEQIPKELANKHAANYAPGDFVPWHFAPGVVVASFFASLSGTLLTVELLQRKRLGKTFMSRRCMHYIGNRSVILANGENQLQLIYSPGYTGLSCVLPVLGLAVAFQIAELNIRSFLLRRLLDAGCGIIAGISIVSMHYVRNLGAMNYTLIYPRRYIVASCIVAVGDSIVALTLFFYLKEKWINVCWKRGLCAFMLAVGVCGMHFTASIGCRYKLENMHSQGPNQRNIPVIVAATLCFVAAISCLLMLLYVKNRERILANRAQYVMLACAYFDEHGNIMITNEGVLPSQIIARRFVLQRFDDHFGIHHPIFFWIWKVSCDWTSIADLVPRMRAHMQRNNRFVEETCMKSSSSSTYNDEESYYDSTILFREGFCMAAADLAEQSQAPLDRLGALYDQVLGTGLLMTRKSRTLDDNSTQQSAVLEKGQLLFFTRMLRPGETEHYDTAGFRFVPLGRVVNIIAKTVQLPVDLLEVHMQRVNNYAHRTSILSSTKHGTYFVCFAALARVRGTFQVLVPKDRQEELPDVQVTKDILTPWQIEYLQRYDGWTAKRMIWHVRLKGGSRDDDEGSFAIIVQKALEILSDGIGESWFADLIFNAEPLSMRYGANKAQKDGMTVVFGFSRLVDIHKSVFQLPRGFQLADWEFFRMRQRYYPGCNDQGRLRHEVHAEFGAFLTRHEKAVQLVERRANGGPGQTDVRRSPGSSILKRESWIESPDGEGQRDSADSIAGSGTNWGGILTIRDTIVEESSRAGGSVEMHRISPQATAGATAVGQIKETKTYVDFLYERARSQPTQAPEGLGL